MPELRASCGWRLALASLSSSTMFGSQSGRGARALRMGLAAAGGITVAGASQALWLKSRYKSLPAALGPTSGVATWAHQVCMSAGA